MKGTLVFAGAMSHAPGIVAFTEAASDEQATNFFKACETMREKLVAARPDVLVVIAPDHFSNFFIDNMPSVCVTLNSDYQGPVEKWLEMDEISVPGMPEFAQSILAHAYQNDIEPAMAHDVKLEHGVIIPLSLLTPQFDVPVIWVMQNCQVPPLMSLKRCYDFGRSIRQAIDNSGLRVAVVGTGGLSHSPGAPEAQTLLPSFDKHFLELLAQPDREKLLSISNASQDEAGFGAWEIRLWITALGAAHDRVSRTLAYEAIVPWDTGCGVVIYE
ncbi:MAG: hypothetical protein CL536_05830 [Alcaligenaceae bacterium]|nr:hypothetical protein [Alcaligenaceae bacterium]